jgi:hypothetical protein
MHWPQRDRRVASSQLQTNKSNFHFHPLMPGIMTLERADANQENPQIGWVSSREGRYAPPVHMIKLTETREIAPYTWVHPNGALASTAE